MCNVCYYIHIETNAVPNPPYYKKEPTMKTAMILIVAAALLIFVAMDLGKTAKSNIENGKAAVTTQIDRKLNIR